LKLVENILEPGKRRLASATAWGRPGCRSCTYSVSGLLLLRQTGRKRPHRWHSLSWRGASTMECTSQLWSPSSDKLPWTPTPLSTPTVN